MQKSHGICWEKRSKSFVSETNFESSAPPCYVAPPLTYDKRTFTGPRRLPRRLHFLAAYFLRLPKSFWNNLASFDMGVTYGGRMDLEEGIRKYLRNKGVRLECVNVNSKLWQTHFHFLFIIIIMLIITIIIFTYYYCSLGSLIPLFIFIFFIVLFFLCSGGISLVNIVYCCC